MSTEFSHVALLERLRVQAEELTILQQEVARLAEEKEKLLTLAREADRRLEDQLAAMDEWDWFFKNSLDILLVHDNAGKLIKVNPAVERLLGYTAEEFSGISIEQLTHPADLDHVMAHMKSVAGGKDGVNFEARSLHKNGTYRWLAWTTPSPLEDGRTMEHMYSIARDITDSKLSQDELLRRAQHDVLTGLANRAAFEQSLALMLARAEMVPESTVSLMLLDLDGFKQINDTLGHRAGDEVLRVISRRLREATRKGDVVARLGGDEFACLLLGISKDAIDALATRFLELVMQPVAIGDQLVQIGCSIGIASDHGAGIDPARFFDQADRAMYEVKARGKCGIAHAERDSPSANPRDDARLGGLTNQ